MSYTELSIEERVTIQIGQYQALSQREIARLLGRSPSSISRELRRNRYLSASYSAYEAQTLTRVRRQAYRPAQKLVLGNELFELIIYLSKRERSSEICSSINASDSLSSLSWTTSSGERSNTPGTVTSRSSRSVLFART